MSTDEEIYDVFDNAMATMISYSTAFTTCMYGIGAINLVLFMVTFPLTLWRRKEINAARCWLICHNMVISTLWSLATTVWLQPYLLFPFSNVYFHSNASVFSMRIGCYLFPILFVLVFVNITATFVYYYFLFQTDDQMLEWTRAPRINTVLFSIYFVVAVFTSIIMYNVIDTFELPKPNKSPFSSVSLRPLFGGGLVSWLLLLEFLLISFSFIFLNAFLIFRLPFWRSEMRSDLRWRRLLRHVTVYFLSVVGAVVIPCIVALIIICLGIYGTSRWPASFILLLPMSSIGSICCVIYLVEIKQFILFLKSLLSTKSFMADSAVTTTPDDFS